MEAHEPVELFLANALLVAVRAEAEGPAPYPDNFAVRTWESLLFPATPGAAAQCAKCHGEGNAAWLAPTDRDHPTAQGTTVSEWRVVCAACHTSQAAVAHIESNTAPSGSEACAICHDRDELYAVEAMHRLPPTCSSAR
jgi:hypothetical protein